jgi:hypothetical protein
MGNQAAKVIECPCGVVLRGTTDENHRKRPARAENHEMADREQAMSWPDC